jgi:hypothetical protein
MRKEIRKSMRLMDSSKTAAFRKGRCFGPALGLAVCTVAILMAGCGSSSKPVLVNPSGGLATMPTPPAPTTANTYVGTDSMNLWSLSLDDNAGTYSYTNSTETSAPVTGTVAAMNGFLNLGEVNGVSLGYALEVQSRMALLRPGDATAGLVLSVPQTTCYDIPYRLRFNYIPMEAGAAYNHTFTTSNYGSVVASTNSTGASWQYENLQGSIVSGPASFTGSCAVANGQAAMSVSGNSLFNLYNNNYSPNYLAGNTLNTSLAIGSSGVFVSNQANESSPTPSHNAAGVAGVAEPAIALTTTTVAAGKYLGFITQPVTGANSQFAGTTSPVSFGQTASSGTTMTGGVFPNDDVTLPPNANISITLGAQSSTYNGLYPNAAVTMLDPNQNCTTWINQGNSGSSSLTVGTTADGYVTCTFPVVAVVGNPEGKYVIFLDAFNYTAGSYSSSGTTQLGAPMQIYLFQQ